ncbi:putative 2- -hydroxypropyl- dehydrogenase protein [Eutypa lata UCREL1]|uniref:Putative 2--hydroxypropyl-dehydrogenase protein n=1 Tax=Eutypa lata (strain UCR-EL1) TaxID=1287681 RepID=M7SV44_EUTLA|nr:putative 2- -hydroxypropyl- dehydrogenase protein [Eutypa lata UCREL1]
MNIDGHVLIFGGGSGIGEACALAFAKEGAAGIVLADINLNDAEQVVMACEALATSADFKAKAVYVNIIQEALVEQTIAQTVELFGRIDYCVNCAGIGVEHANEVAKANVSEFDRFIDVNVKGTLNGTIYYI